MSVEHFPKFSALVEKQLAAMTGHLYVSKVDPNHLWDTYLAAFPEGTNPVYIERTEHNCNCCRNFVRNLGCVVAVHGSKLVTVWDGDFPYPYDIVAAKLREVVLMHGIKEPYFTKQPNYGSKPNLGVTKLNKVIQWSHFWGTVPAASFKAQPQAAAGVARASHDVLLRGVKELTRESIEAALDLIAANQLYKGEQSKAGLVGLLEVQSKFNALATDPEREILIWEASWLHFATIRNTAIGTFLQDLSAGKPPEVALEAYEKMTAPENYKRPVAAITPKMVEAAVAELKELRLEGAVHRRFAHIEDVSVNDVLYVDNSVRGRMKDSGGLAELLAGEVKAPTVDLSKAVPIKIDEFMSEVVPKATGIKVLVKNNQEGNFVSVTAPVDEDSGQLFKWANDFAWSYKDNVADAIKARVKAAGGNVDNAQLRVSLAWFNTDDLDLHCEGPSGNELYYKNKYEGKQQILDVDMNAGWGTTMTPVENMAWKPGSIKDGVYRFYVKQYAKRNSSNVGFQIQLATADSVQVFAHKQGLASGAKVLVLTLKIKSGAVESSVLGVGLASDAASRTVWGVPTEQLTKVDSIMNSPNYWGNNRDGAKHWFFVLDGCRNPEPTRGFYNEFLNKRLAPHRKVFEVLADKTKCVQSDNQLSGVGFTAARGDSLLAVVQTDKDQRSYKVNF